MIRDSILRSAGRVSIACIFIDGFLTELARELPAEQADWIEKNHFVSKDGLDMERIIQKFASYYADIFAQSNETFLEDNGRCLFLLFIKPLIIRKLQGQLSDKIFKIIWSSLSKRGMIGR